MTDTTETTETTYRAAEVKIRAFKRARAVDLLVPEDGVTLAGRNGAGKSSILDAIASAIGGGGVDPERPIQDGRAVAGVRLTLAAREPGAKPERIVIERRYQRGDDGESHTASLVVRYDDESIRRPQSALDALRGAAVDPQAWADPPGVAKPEARDRARLRQLVASLAGDDAIDLDAHARERERLADRRLRAGRDKRAKAAHVEELGPAPLIPDEPDPEAKRHAEERARKAEAAVSAWKLRERDRQDRLREAWEEAERSAQTRREADDRLLGAIDDVERLRAALAEAEASVLRFREAAEAAEAESSTAIQRYDQVELEVQNQRVTDPTPDPAEEVRAADQVLAEWQRAREERQAALAGAEQHRQAVADAERAEDEWRELDDQVRAMDGRLARAVASLPMPPEVEITPELRVMLRTRSGTVVPIDQASQAERDCAAVGVAAGLCGRLRLLWVRHGALLDADSRRAMAETAASVGVQLIVETVEPTEGSVVIEDGRVAAAKEEKDQ